MDLSVERDAHCFCCGADNANGLHLKFEYPAPGEAEARLVIPAYFSGWKEITHGGFLSMLLDEVMAHSCIHLAKSAVTGEITVRFIKPVATGTEVRLSGRITETKGRIIATQGWIRDPAGATVAEATARFIATTRVDGNKTE